MENPKFRKYLVYRRAKKVTVDAPEGFSLSIDGEIVEGTHFDIEVMHNAANFAVPGIVSAMSKKKKPSEDMAMYSNAVSLPT